MKFLLTMVARRSLVMSALVVSACAGPGPRPPVTEQPDVAMLDRLARIEQTMSRLGVTLESLEQELQAFKAPAAPGVGVPENSHAGQPFGHSPGWDRDCERRAGGQQVTHPGRSFSTW